MKTFVVVPTIRTLDFLKEWEDEFCDSYLLIIEDHEDKETQFPKIQCKGVYHYTWRDIARDFGRDEWIFSRKNAGIRSYGFWKAYTLGADTTVTLDDDCYPTEEAFIKKHIKNLSLKAPTGWTTTYPHSEFIFTRGIPYSVREQQSVVISHGLWTNKIDLDGKTEVQHVNLSLPLYPPFTQFIPEGVYFPMCSMNLAFSRKATPLMYFPLMGFDPDGGRWGYDRFDDIWAGIFAKKILDHLHMSVVNGSPFVEHRKASDPQKNIVKEKAGLAVNEHLWRAVHKVNLTASTPSLCYRELAKKTVFPKEKYFEKLRSAMMIWANLF